MAHIQGENTLTIGRNDPCHCGSGKKYKKCCGKDEAAKTMFEEQNKVLREVLQEFFENHPRPSEQKELLAWKDTTENLLVPLYGEEKSNGIIGDLFFFLKRVDVWNAFIEHKARMEERPQLKQVLSAWPNPEFLVGEILSITEYKAQMRDLLSGDTKEIEVNESFPVETGNLAIGFYLPDVRISPQFVMALNSVTAVVEPKPETIQKMKDMYQSSEATEAQEFYRNNALSVYKQFSSGIRSTEQVPPEVLETVQSLEQFLIEHDLKSDDLIESFFHYLEPLPEVPKAAIPGAIQFGISQKLLKFDWSSADISRHFQAEMGDIQQFAEELQAFYDKAVANQEKEAAYAFEVGTNPKSNELQNWNLYMHLKHATITSESALKRQMEYYHDVPYEPKSDAEQAQLTAYEAYQVKTEKERIAKFEQLQRLDHQNADGFLLAAEVESEPSAREALLKKAVSSGEKQFEPEMEVAWLYVPNRPYLRALFLLGNLYWEQSRFEEAFDKYQKLLLLNPADHQGVRYMAISALLATDRLEEAESLIGHYEQENTDNAFYAWFKWLIQRKRQVLSNKTQEAYLEAIEKNPYAKKYVENRYEPDPYPASSVITPRSPEEARLIWTFLAPSLTN
ncbi:tetratricopeptide repeat protein [Planococcus salinus]|uniref:Uncharacterized protein n=1 Tax=Planococcus salinus TaxID=1848460 RepID=A0A3M8PC20_9BACL|nr:SEC-C metal-binding domain-containing protein [Planococcus salinus]RNF41183.1 hypothetical protein EEX84_02205 [Planococcus salinus]